MFGTVRSELQDELREIRAGGLYKEQRVISSPQAARVTVEAKRVLNFCSNNYLGLADHPDLLAAAKLALDEWGFGMASVRFICGTQDPHVRLEQRISEFLGTEDSILYGSCFEANGGVFETLLGPEDAVISDELNHASIIDGIRLSKARRSRYRNRDLADLARRLDECSAARRRLIVTDGVFSMDGYLAPLDGICELAAEHGAMVMVDDSHATGFVGPSGRGTPEHFGVQDQVDIITGTLGKALGGASGGYVSGHAEIVDLLRQRSRPYLFSNSVAPPIVGAAIRVFDMLDEAGGLRSQLVENAVRFRSGIAAAGFEVLDGDHPIVPVMLHDAKAATDLAAALQDRHIYVTAFSYPVVPMGQARIRVQMSAAHSTDDIDEAVSAFAAARDVLGL